MDKIDIEYYQSWFAQYVQQYLAVQESNRLNYQLKFEHSLRVRDIIVELGESLNLDQTGLALCQIIGLMHDLGRFKQYAEYNTFSDLITGSHAKFSVDILNENKLLQNLKKTQQEIVLKAIEYHNYYRIPEGKSAEILLFSQLLRDADKLDGYYIVTNDHDQRRYDLEGLSQDKYFSRINLEALLNSQPIEWKNVRYQFDRKLVMLGLVFDLNFKRSFELIKENDYIKRLISQLPDTCETRRIGRHCTEYVRTKLESGRR